MRIHTLLLAALLAILSPAAQLDTEMDTNPVRPCIGC